ncbi:MAG: ABC transporter substrate-binding protein [Clostridia bacterium]|nr:ABC transporter substrate-binding protein [Clostridia bacterium]
MKKLISFWLVFLLLTNLMPIAWGEAEARIVTDSTGRQIWVPQQITRIAVTGPMTQHVLFALAPQMLVGISSPWDAEALPYIPKTYQSLPVIGQLYGGKGTMNLEALLAAAPQIVLDVGEGKEGIGEDMERLSEQTGIPFIHIDAGLFTFDEAFTALGELLNCEPRAQQLATFCRDVLGMAQGAVEQQEKVRLLYIVGNEGLGVIAKGSYQASVFDLMSDNIAVVDAPSARGTGNEVDMEQLLLWDPDCIIFSPNSMYDQIDKNPAWQHLKAIRSGNYYEAPFEPHNWMGFPPTCQRMMGLLWMGKLLYPETATYDLYEQISRYFELFYHSELTREQFDGLVEHSLGKQR